MYKKIIAITILSIVTGLVILNSVKIKDIEVEKTQKQVNNTNMLTMMLETEAGTGNYEEVKQSEWPQDGYAFNESLSRCENGGTLSWDDNAKKVILNTDVSDKCYIYFDIYNPTLTELCAGKTLADCIKENVYIEDGENGLYYHEGVGTYTNASEEAGDNSYRYSGTNPNNFVCFGSDELTCADDNLYRIIGLFDDDQDGIYNIKLISNNSIGNSNWDSDNISFNSLIDINNGNNEYTISQMNNILAAPENPFGGNEWATADINYYINYDLFWNKLENKWQNMIATTVWNVGGNTDDNILYTSVKNAYQNEIINPIENITYSDEIGLMYVSDYGYAASPGNWTTRLSDYDNDTNTANNWMYMGLFEWTITTHTPGSAYVFYVHYYGDLGYSNPDEGNAARPVFYLKSNVRLVDGNGTASDPYKIA